MWWRGHVVALREVGTIATATFSLMSLVVQRHHLLMVPGKGGKGEEGGGREVTYTKPSNIPSQWTLALRHNRQRTKCANEHKHSQDCSSQGGRERGCGLKWLSLFNLPKGGVRNTEPFIIVWEGRGSWSDLKYILHFAEQRCSGIRRIR